MKIGACAKVERPVSVPSRSGGRAMTALSKVVADDDPGNFSSLTNTLRTGARAAREATRARKTSRPLAYMPSTFTSVPTGGRGSHARSAC